MSLDRSSHHVGQDVDVATYVGILLKRKWFFFTILFAVLLATTVFTYTRTPIYRSEATILVGGMGKDSVADIGKQLVERFETDEVYATEAEILMSRSIAGALVDEMNLAASPEFRRSENGGLISSTIAAVTRYLQPGRAASSAPLSKYEQREALIDAVLKRLSVSRQGDSRVLRLGMEAKDPEMAKLLLERYIHFYMERNRVERQRIVLEAAAWLKKEMVQSEKKLVESLAALTKFTNEHGMVSMDNEANHFLTFFNKASERLVRGKERVVQLEASLEGGQAAPVGALPSGMKPVDLHNLHEKLALLEARYAEMAEIYSEDYPRMGFLKRQIEVLREKIGESEKNAVSAALEAARKQSDLDKRDFEQAKKEALESNSLGVQFAVLKKEVETNEQIFKILLSKSKETDLHAQIIGNNVAVVDAPQVPLVPVRPRKALILFGGVVAGFMLAFLSVLLFEHLDDKVRSGEDIERGVDLPSLGAIPDARKLKLNPSPNGGRPAYELVPFDAPRSRLADAVNNITTSILLTASAANSRSLLITSAVPGEGKTFLTAAIGCSMSTADRKVLLVDLDLRKPSLSEVFGESNGAVGLSTLLTRNNVKISDVVRRSRVPGLYYLGAGAPASNPSAVLRSRRLIRLLDYFKGVFDFLIFDAPPIVGFPDAQIASDFCDTTILVCKEGYVPVQLLKHAKSLLAMSSSNILGVVLNMADLGLSHYGGYRYYDHYRYYKYDKYYNSDKRSGKRSKTKPTGQTVVSPVSPDNKN